MVNRTPSPLAILAFFLFVILVGLALFALVFSFATP